MQTEWRRPARLDALRCAFTLLLTGLSVCVDVSQQPLGDNRKCWTGPRTSAVRDVSDTEEGDRLTEAVSKRVSMRQTGVKSFLLLETSQSKGTMEEKSQEKSRFFDQNSRSDDDVDFYS